MTGKNCLMRKISGLLDGVPVSLHLAKSRQEYRDGVRTLGGKLTESEGILFDFGAPMQILLENSGVSQDLCVLYFSKFRKYGIVEEVKTLNAFDSNATSSVGFYQIAIELPDSFCRNHQIRKGSTLILKEDL